MIDKIPTVDLEDKFVETVRTALLVFGFDKMMELLAEDCDASADKMMLIGESGLALTMRMRAAVLRAMTTETAR